MLVIDRAYGRYLAQKKPLQHRSLCCSGFLFQQLSINKRLKNLSAVLIHAERKFGVPLHSPDEPFIRQTYGLR